MPLAKVVLHRGVGLLADAPVRLAQGPARVPGYAFSVSRKQVTGLAVAGRDWQEPALVAAASRVAWKLERAKQEAERKAIEKCKRELGL